MKKILKPIGAMAVLLVMLISLVPLHADAAITENASLKKLTDSYTSGDGSFTLKVGARLFVLADTEPSEELQQTASLISAEFGAAGLPCSAALPQVWGTAEDVLKGDIILELVEGLAADGYRLTITADNLKISASDTDGLLYGAFMAIKHFQVYKEYGMQIPACIVQDEPDTKERTVMLDCARKYWSVEWIKNLIRQMSWMGYNTLELHMTEDQGMHMNIWSEGNDCNGNDFSWLCGYQVASWATDAPDLNGNNNYSAADIREIVALAQDYHIEIIPSVDVPGHCDYMNNKYEDKVASDSSFTFHYDGKTYTADGIVENGVCTAYDTTAYPNAKFERIRNNSTAKTVDVTNPVGRAFSLAMLQAYARFFWELGCTKFNFGCDEVVLDAKVDDVVVDDCWGAYAASHVNGTNNNYDTIYDYNNEVYRLLISEGYTGVRAFNEVLYNTSATVTLNPDIEICYWEEPGSGFDSVAKYLSAGHTVYNCCQNYCYYVLRNSTASNGGDARDKDCLAWSFTHGTEDRIFSGCGGGCKNKTYSWYPCNSNTGWNPSKLSSIPNSSEYYYTEEQLGGGYFLIWGDWAGWRTEAQVWNGEDGSDTYNLIDRMWSNSIKMWNWDVDSTSSSNGLSYSDYWPLRNFYHLYPGFTTPSAAPSIPTASAIHQVADFTELKAQIAVVPDYESGKYTESSYSAYLAALNKANAVLNNTASTQAEVDAAVKALKSAYDGLVRATTHILYKTIVNGEPRVIEDIRFDGGKITLEVTGRRGYRFLRVEGNASLQPYYSGAEGGIVTGTVTEQEPIVIWYENNPQLATLEALLSADDTAIYTDANTAYKTAKDNAKTFYDGIKASPKTLTTQEDIDAIVDELIEAKTGAVITADETKTKIITLKSTTDVVAQGKSAVLLVTTSPDVKSLSIEGVTFNDYESKPTVTDSGKQVKIWYLSFIMTTAREEAYTYTVTAVGAQTVTADISIYCN